MEKGNASRHMAQLQSAESLSFSDLSCWWLCGVWLWACHSECKSIEIIQAADLVARLPVTRSCILAANPIRTELSTFENDDRWNKKVWWNSGNCPLWPALCNYRHMPSFPTCLSLPPLDVNRSLTRLPCLTPVSVIFGQPPWERRAPISWESRSHLSF